MKILILLNLQNNLASTQTLEWVLNRVSLYLFSHYTDFPTKQRRKCDRTQLPTLLERHRQLKIIIAPAFSSLGSTTTLPRISNNLGNDGGHNSEGFAFLFGSEISLSKWITSEVIHSFSLTNDWCPHTHPRIKSLINNKIIKIAEFWKI